VLCACIDIGSNTTRLLVAEPDGAGALAVVLQQRAFTCVGSALDADGRIAAAKVEEVAAEVTRQHRLAEVAGAVALRAVATAAIRRATNHAELVEATRAACGVEVEVLPADEEARLAFLGATRMLEDPCDGDLAVVDVGGGSTEIVVGNPCEGVRYSVSLPLGSGTLTDQHLRSDPPSGEQLRALRAEVARALDGVAPPRPRLALAAGGSATSLHRMVGPEIDADSIARALAIICAAPIAEVARRFDLDHQRVRLLPAGITVLAAVAERLGQSLCVGRGGLREGILFELFDAEGGPA